MNRRSTKQHSALQSTSQCSTTENYKEAAIQGENQMSFLCRRDRGAIHLVPLFVAGAMFGEVLVPSFVASAVPVPLFVAGRLLGEVFLFLADANIWKRFTLSELWFYCRVC